MVLVLCHCLLKLINTVLPSVFTAYMGIFRTKLILFLIVPHLLIKLVNALGGLLFTVGQTWIQAYMMIILKMWGILLRACVLNSLVWWSQRFMVSSIIWYFLPLYYRKGLRTCLPDHRKKLNVAAALVFKFYASL